MKKKLFPVALLVLLSASVSGCPVYEDEDGCIDDYDCSGGYFCDYSSGACLREGSGSSAACSAPSDCAVNETCSKSGICAEGDCHFASVGCVRGFECSGQNGRWECVRPGAGSGGTSGGTGGANAGGPSASAGEAGAGLPAGGADGG
jgi:hypothetical protein